MKNFKVFWNNFEHSMDKLNTNDYVLAIATISTAVSGIALTIPGLYNVMMPATALSATVTCRQLERKINKRK